MPRCKCCKEKFTPKKFLQKYCKGNDDCLAAEGVAFIDNMRRQNEKKKKEVAKKDRAELRVMKASLLSHKDYIKMTQVVFNTFIRLRDKSLPCVSCGTNVDSRKGNASHYFSAGGNPNVRFDEDNVHNSCVPCNMYFHGALIEYGLRLPKRIGQERFDALLARRNTVRKYSIPELKEMITHYKKRIKELK